MTQQVLSPSFCYDRFGLHMSVYCLLMLNQVWRIFWKQGEIPNTPKMRLGSKVKQNVSSSMGERGERESTNRADLVGW